MDYLTILIFLQILLVALWLVKINYHFRYMKCIKEKYVGTDFFAFILSVSSVFDRIYVNSPFFVFNADILSTEALRLGKLARIPSSL